MKITRTLEEANELERNKELANQGCHNCPGCGEYFKDSGIVRNGYDKDGYWQINCYYCNNCGVQWESDKYYLSYKKHSSFYNKIKELVAQM